MSDDLAKPIVDLQPVTFRRTHCDTHRRVRHGAGKEHVAAFQREFYCLCVGGHLDAMEMRLHHLGEVVQGCLVGCTEMPGRQIDQAQGAQRQALARA